jgi:hypothetical protein
MPQLQPLTRKILLPKGHVMRRIPLDIAPLLLLGLPFSLHYPFLLSSSQEGARPPTNSS